MTPEQFTYWLQGFVEINENPNEAKGITREQWKVIKDHLKTVFHKITPDYTITSTQTIPNSQATFNPQISNPHTFIC